MPSVSETLGAALGNAARKAGIDPATQASTGHVVWAAMGGWRGVAESVIPSLAFILAFTLWPGEGMGKLIPALIISVGIAVVFTVIRFAMRQPPAAAIGGLVAALAAAALALLTGNASNNFVPGLLTNAGYGLAMLVSAIVGWPIIGLAAGYLMGEGTAWRRSVRKRRVFTGLTIVWAALFLLRLAVQLPVYIASLQPGQQDGAVALLGTLKLVMGLPLFAPVLAITWLTIQALYRRERADAVVSGA
ncbi:tryptophan-rich sensory protein [Microbacterium resistens]|uniref:Tryptophan-rich sensory protein n=1 Tax=Microbacterium resistens TaxID=156977 RepID=A0ABU1S9A4_9MICO|nr:DUF3159 domain-containing protein [Microbacterium resistens]MDR6866160.1 tryptophan-rich sensory protein [Microbacterium resistens]